MATIKKIVEKSRWWERYDSDPDSVIIDKGDVYLFDDGSREYISDFPWSERPQYPSSILEVNENEYRDYLRKNYGVVFAGDEVKITRGKKYVGETKKVTSSFTFAIKGTYGKCVEYLVFTDGTRVCMKNCENSTGNVKRYCTDNDYRHVIRLGGCI